MSKKSSLSNSARSAPAACHLRAEPAARVRISFQLRGVRPSAGKRLEQLCRHTTRPRDRTNACNSTLLRQVELKLRTPSRDGTTHGVMKVSERMQRMEAPVRRLQLHRPGRPDSHLWPETAPGREPPIAHTPEASLSLERAPGCLPHLPTFSGPQSPRACQRSSRETRSANVSTAWLTAGSNTP